MIVIAQYFIMPNSDYRWVWKMGIFGSPEFYHFCSDGCCTKEFASFILFLSLLFQRKPATVQQCSCDSRQVVFTFDNKQGVTQKNVIPLALTMNPFVVCLQWCGSNKLADMSMAFGGLFPYHQAHRRFVLLHIADKV